MGKKNRQTNIIYAHCYQQSVCVLRMLPDTCHTSFFVQLSFPWGSSQSLTMQCSSVKDLMQSFPRCSSQGLAMYCTSLKDLAQQRSFLLFQLKSHSPSVQVFNRMLTRRNFVLEFEIVLS